MSSNFLSIQINKAEATDIAWDLYQIKGEIIPLAGEIDFNFRIITEKESYLLKISRPNFDEQFLAFQQAITNHISESKTTLLSPRLLPNKNGDFLSKIEDGQGNARIVRLLSWIDGRLWSSVNPQKDDLLYSLGEQAGMLANTLRDFDYPLAHRLFDWDIAQADWTFDHHHLFNEKQKNLVKYFQQKFIEIQGTYQSLRKSVIHNDINDNNIVVSENLIKPKVIAIIDYGDAIYSQTINELAITIAYAVMNKTDVLSAAIPVIKGFHKNFQLLEKELDVLYGLVAMRLVISVTKSAINRKEEPDNKYLLVSEAPAWEVLEKWEQIDDKFALYSFREACDLTPHPNEETFKQWAIKQKISIKDLFPKLESNEVCSVDMSVESTWLGHESEYLDNDLMSFKLKRLSQHYHNSLIAGGYLENRPLYITNAYKKESNNGPVYRSVHLGTDFWVEAQTPIHALFDGKVYSIYNNAHDKDYGPTLILEHKTNHGITFYSLHGHLSKDTLKLTKTNQSVQKGDLIGYVGTPIENGNWASHLHFQVMQDMLGNTHDFPGVAMSEEISVWKSICPDPNLFFRKKELEIKNQKKASDLIAFRKKHLGKSLSLSYDIPIEMVRGSGAYLIAGNGRKYLDTVNNVAHVGHEHPRIVKAGQEQMAVLNTNSRYLHENINDLTEALLSTFPQELSVVHFVNSGSEANELALRMAKAFTGQKDMIAVEVGYHGNTSACIDVSSYKFDGKGGKGAPEYTHIVPLPDAYRGLYQGENTGEKYAAHIQNQIENIQKKGRNVAGFICESIISCGGQIELPNNYLKTTYESVRIAGGICIADEVQVGCGRVGSHFWGFQLHDVIPDIVTIGKPIGNGHPLAAVICTRAVADAFANGMEYFNTFGGNPVSCAIGNEVLKVIQEEHLQQNALNVGNYLKSELCKLQNDFPEIGDVRGQGLFLGFELIDKYKKPLTKKTIYLANRMKELGILMSTDGKDNNVLKIKPPMTFSIENANELLYRLRSVFLEDFMTT